MPLPLLILSLLPALPHASPYLITQVQGPARAEYLIVAADVFMYLDDLAPVLKAAAAVLAPSAVVAFSVETHDGDGVMLRDTLRYAHGAAHVRAALEAAGLTLVSLDSASTRTEKNVPVPGLIVVAKS